MSTAVLETSKIEEHLSHIPEAVDSDTYRRLVSAVLRATGGDVEEAVKHLNAWSEESRDGLYRSDLKRYADEDASLSDLAREHRDDPANPSRSAEKKSEEDHLLEIVQDVEVFKAPDGSAHASFSSEGARRTARIDGSFFEDYLREQYFRSQNSAVSDKAISRVTKSLGAKAAFGDAEYPVYLRVAEKDGALYIDIGDDSGEAFKVTAERWSITSTPPVRFIRSPGMGSLPRPVQSGDLGPLRSFLPNVSTEDYSLILAWMVYALQPKGPYPILAITGEQGSAKSTITRLIGSVIDPAQMELRSLPGTGQDLAIAAENSWVLSFDNMDAPTNTISDALCRLSSGGGFATRTLYSNREESIFYAARPMIFNGITSLFKRPDLADRSIQIELEPIRPQDRKTEDALWSEFDAQRSTIFGGLLSALSTALANHDSVQLQALPRMADFAQWAVAAESAFPVPAGTFVAAYDENREQASRKILDEEPLARFIYDLVHEHKNRRWKGTTQELMDLVAEREEKYLNASFMSSIQKFTSTRDRIIPELKRMGIEYEVVNKRDRTFAFYLMEEPARTDNPPIHERPEARSSLKSA